MSELSFVTTLVRAAVDRRLHELTDRWRSRLPGEAGADLLGPAQQALSGGKRMRPVLAAVGRDLGLGEFIRLGKGETLSGGRDKDSILSDTVEALIGATYLTHGLEPTRVVVERLVSRFLAQARTRGAGLDWKTSLQELTAVHDLGAPVYQVTGEGPDHARVFTATAVIDHEVYGTGTGSSKKVAEHDAAEAAYAAILAARGDGGLDLPGVNDALRADLVAHAQDAGTTPPGA